MFSYIFLFLATNAYLIASRIPPGRVVQSIGDRSQTAQEHSKSSPQDSLKTPKSSPRTWVALFALSVVFVFMYSYLHIPFFGQTGHHQKHRNCKQINESNQRIESTNPFDESHQEIESMN